MEHPAFEQELWRKTKKQRLIHGVICAISFAIVIICWSAYENSKVVKEIVAGYLRYQSVKRMDLYSKCLRAIFIIQFF